MMHRLFVAFRLPEAVRTNLLALMCGVSAARWQRDDQLHLTLRYIGEVDSRVAEDVVAALSGVRAAAVELALSGAGQFGEGKSGHALWVGVTPHEAVTALHKKIDHALVRAGLEPDHRAYLPHITVARMGKRSGPTDHWLAANAGASYAPFVLKSFALYESILTSDGAAYRVIEEFPLNPAHAPMQPFV